MAGERIVIIGAGPTGIGAAWRLNELGHSDWVVFERHDRAGGLSASYVDDHGFTWDIGGHVLFSHYAYFDRLMDQALSEWVCHERESWIWTHGRFVPYPFQYNIRHLPAEAQWECVLGLVRLRKHGLPLDYPVGNFRDWLLATFGEGLARYFMFPYNLKVWAWPLEEMSCHWTGDRVAVVDLDRILDNVVVGRDDVGWGPNSTFRFPLRGGTGAIWQSLAAKLPADRIHCRSRIVAIDPQRRIVRLESGEEVAYDILINTMPLDRLIEAAGLDDLRGCAARLERNSVYVFGIGLRGQKPPPLATKCWMYFPEDNCPFYRVTVFSNYSPGNVPDPSRYWSLMAEVSCSRRRPVIEPENLADRVIEGLKATRLLPDQSEIVSLWQTHVPYAYPIPSLGRDEALAEILPALERSGIYSRGRFGAWKYEVGNQDHSAMQGVELINRLLNGEAEITLNDPDAVNAARSSQSSS
ncbi:FAD-dependent oxidoreductase [Candidatus Sumerlaeota bacterium]|nr:FAD-dependent oxidoreductase [Candidatus Sumerlaeota bacterium]